MRNAKMIHALGNCINHCNYCADACLSEENVKKMVKCIRLDSVCAEACAALAQILAIQYDNIEKLVQYCKEVCLACAEECGKHDHDHCKICAEACQECATACEDYLENG